MDGVLGLWSEPGAEDRGGAVVFRKGNRAYDECTGEDVDRETVKHGLEIVRGYVKNMEQFLKDIEDEEDPD